MSRKKISAAAAVLTTVFFLWLAARNVEISALGRVLSEARWRWLPCMILVCLLDLLIRAVRWRLLLSQAGRAPLGELFRLSAIGLAVNNVLFARLGEVVRAVLAARQLGLSMATTVASVVVERALDVCALLTLFAAAGMLLPELVPFAWRRAGLLVLAGVVAALAFLILAERTLEAGGLVERRLRRWRKLHEMIVHLALGAAVLRRVRTLASVIALSLALWAVDAAMYWFSARALGLEGLLDYTRSILVLSWAGAGAALPAVPGAIGTFEAMVKDILVRLGAVPGEAFAYALFTHMLMYIVVTGIGLACLYRVGLSLAGIKASLEQRKP
ncbi:MAG: lysylphosphatidylglycerol synthase transmembrane domain-containing protein [Elusimicrobia bacterium]|nr:lysylphosphatidylglycerol synthase transmembrane domain-containing protein [Elusimicrobiota bacterium]